MTAVALSTAGHVALADPIKTFIKSYVAAVAITAGQEVYILTTGKVGLADANDAGKIQARGIALQTVGAGFAVDVLHDGDLDGFDVASLNVDALLYLSNTPGGLDTAAGSTSVAVARVTVKTDKPTYTKCIHVFTKWDADWA